VSSQEERSRAQRASGANPAASARRVGGRRAGVGCLASADFPPGRASSGRIFWIRLRRHAIPFWDRAPKRRWPAGRAFRRSAAGTSRSCP
jgi:hypothetical protein